jgi:riboflavin kinase/FMN adenylyltransferase
MTEPTVVTLGVFDGFHRGHAAVVRRARERADAQGDRLAVFTFGTHPRLILDHAGAPPELTTTGEKVALLREAGADTVRVLVFDDSLRRKGPRRFLEEHVYPFHRLTRLVVGYDFAMGRDRAGTVPVLAALGERLGFAVERVGAREAGDAPVSSTRIREALAAGEVEEAAVLLGRPYALSGSVVPGDALGRRLGFPTANLRIDGGKLRPGHGVYAVRVDGAGAAGRPGVANLGVRPTVGDGRDAVEVHLLDYDGDLRGTRLTLRFQGRLREERKFADLNELAGQIERDVEAARRRLGAPATGGETA